jgi:hypothetical protein
MLDPQGIAWLDQQDSNLAAHIRRYGWHIEYVGGGQCSFPGCDSTPDDEGPPFAYTVGLFGLGHAELLVFGLGIESTAGLLNEVGERVRRGENLVPGQLLSFDGWPHKVVTELVPNPGEIVFTANRHYCRPDAASVPVLQLTYDDTSGRFPWDDGFSDPERQPRPGTFRA